MTSPNPLPMPPRPSPRQPEPQGPTDEQYVAYARQILAWHAPVPLTDGRAPYWCTCGSAIVLCPYQAAATRFLSSPTPGTG